jgi:hypothetical protein
MGVPRRRWRSMGSIAKGEGTSASEHPDAVCVWRARSASPSTCFSSSACARLRSSSSFCCCCCCRRCARRGKTKRREDQPGATENTRHRRDLAEQTGRTATGHSARTCCSWRSASWRFCCSSWRCGHGARSALASWPACREGTQCQTRATDRKTSESENVCASPWQSDTDTRKMARTDVSTCARAA